MQAQAYSGVACTGQGNPALKLWLNQGEIPNTIGNGYAFYEKWSTSLLAPTGTKPKVTHNNNNFDTEEREAEEMDLWTCLYSAYRAHDDDSKTAWCEGAANDGVGEVMMVSLVEPTPTVKIWAGYGKSATTFQNNNRPRKIKLTVLSAQMFGFSTSEQNSMTAKVIATGDAELKDVNGYQIVTLPAYNLADRDHKVLVAIEILSVYPGSKFNDACVSEIR